ncbi:hypothetical protein QE152_g26263 [Popillia japonica]|uniref:Uncharacterized protein n=1 Tax=Popillia japonica TaxID=7064 RepID=A0AAW1JYR1_POPJA
MIDDRPNEPTATAMSTATFGENQPTSIQVPIQLISPLPGCSSSTNGATKGARPKQHSEILTSTPMKERIEERKKNKEKKNEKEGVEKKTTKTTTKTPAQFKLKKVQKALFKSDTDSSLNEDNVCEDELEAEVGLSLGGVGKDVCFYCEDDGKDNELWYRCTSCGLWAHTLCSGWDTPEVSEEIPTKLIYPSLRRGQIESNGNVRNEAGVSLDRVYVSEIFGRLRKLNPADGALWRLNKYLRRERQRINTIQDEDGTIVTHDREIAGKIAEAFESYHRTADTTPQNQSRVQDEINSFLLQNPADSEQSYKYLAKPRQNKIAQQYVQLLDNTSLPEDLKFTYQFLIVLHLLPPKGRQRVAEKHWKYSTLESMNSIFVHAKGKSATVENWMSGFRATGIAPFNPAIIPDYAYTTGIAPFNPAIIPDYAYINIQMEQEARPGSNSTAENPSPPSTPHRFPTIATTNNRNISPLPGYSHDPDTATVEIDPTLDPTPGKLLENVISPIPKTNAKAVVKTREYKEKNRSPVQKKTVVKQKKRLESSDSDNGSLVLQESDTSAEEWDENECVGRGENYFETTKNDEWIKCVNCSRWFHNGCSKFEIFCDLCGKLQKKP